MGVGLRIFPPVRREDRIRPQPQHFHGLHRKLDVLSFWNALRHGVWRHQPRHFHAGAAPHVAIENRSVRDEPLCRGRGR